ASLGSRLPCLPVTPPPHPGCCQNDFARNEQREHACPAVCRVIRPDTVQNHSDDGSQNSCDREPVRRNLLNIHDVIAFTARSQSRRVRIRSTRSATASRPSVVNGQRSAAITTNGSGAATSVHPAGIENNCPLSSRRRTRSSPQFCRKTTNSKSRPD